MAGNGSSKARREQRIEASLLGEGVVLEAYRYGPGPAGEIPRHAHEGYQIGFSLDFPGEYRYRGESHTVPVGSLSVIHPGEVHSARDPHDRQAAVHYLMMYAAPDLLAAAAAISGSGGSHLPFFPNPVMIDRDLAAGLVALGAAPGEMASRLEQDIRLHALLLELVSRHSDTRRSYPLAGRERRATGIVREYLEDNHAANVSLEELSRLCNLSPFHLARVFRKMVGMPPHAYQIQVRVARARDLLLRGWPISRVALETGFADQSHLTRHFKRVVGVTPGSYVRYSKNVL